jgi:hypothetical protein
MSIFRRMANLLHRSRIDRDIDAELQAHIALRTEDSLAAGMSPEQARRDALVRFGNRTVTKERVAAVDTALLISSVGSDIRYALRQLIKNPGFALAAILSLALGIGATVSVFSVIYGVLLHPFPYADVDRLANLSLSDPRGEIFDAGFTGQQFRELRNVHGFEGIATWNSRHLTVATTFLRTPSLSLESARRFHSRCSALARPQSRSFRLPRGTGAAAGRDAALPLLATSLQRRPGRHRQNS